MKMNVLRLGMVAFVAIGATAFAAAPPAHVGLRAAINAGDYAKARSFLKLGVKDVYCGDMPVDSAKALWTKRWKENPELARGNCYGQYVAAFPAADCQGNKATLDACKERLKEVALAQKPEEFLEIAVAALTHPKLKMAKDTVKTKVPCGKNKKCIKDHEEKVRALKADPRGWEMMRMIDEMIRSSFGDVDADTRGMLRAALRAKLMDEMYTPTMLKVELKPILIPFIATLGEGALTASMRGSGERDALPKDLYLRANAWMKVLRELQNKFKIFGPVAAGTYPGGPNWGKNQIDVRLKTTGRFEEDEIDLYCAVDSAYAKMKLAEFTDRGCRNNCGDYYKHGDCCKEFDDGQRFCTGKWSEYHDEKPPKLSGTITVSEGAKGSKAMFSPESLVITDSNDNLVDSLYWDLDNDGIFETVKEFGAATTIQSTVGLKEYAVSVRAKDKVGLFSNTITAEWQSSICANEGVCGMFTDSRDGKKYKWVKIGKQTWMAENMNSGDGRKCPGDSLENCEIFGGMYNSKSAKLWSDADNQEWKREYREVLYEQRHRDYSKPWESREVLISSPRQGICPVGWHIPTRAEFYELFSFVGENVELLIDGRHGGTNKYRLGLKLRREYGADVYWTSEGDWQSGPEVPRFIRVRLDKERVEVYNMGGNDAFVRCVKD